jgi:hypothetical protein
MHGCSHERLIAAMVELSLLPVALFLLQQPARRQVLVSGCYELARDRDTALAVYEAPNRWVQAAPRRRVLGGAL